MEKDTTLSSVFSGWKIFLAIAIGLGIAGWMMYRSLQHEQFIPSESDLATHIWTDVNQDGIEQINEFTPQSFGTHRKQTIGDLVLLLDWKIDAFFWFLAAILFTIGRDFFYMVRIRTLSQKKLSWRSSFHTIMLWEFASALTPGVVGGSAVAMFILNREKIPLGRSTAIVVITAMMDNLFYVVMIPLVFLFLNTDQLFPAQIDYEHGAIWVFWLGFAVIFLISLILFLSIFKFPKLVAKVLNLLFSLPILKKWKLKAIEVGNEVEITSLEFKKKSRSFWFTAFGATFASWISRYLVINCILAAFIPLFFNDHVQVLGKQLVMWLFMLISPTPGASGVAEFAFGELMSNFGSSTLLIATLALIWRLISYFPYLFIGAFLLPRWIRKTGNERK